MQRAAGGISAPPDPQQIRRRTLLIGLLLLLLSSLLYLIRPPLLEDFEGLLLDLRFRLRGSEPATGLVTLVAIDERSLSEVGRWPWDRRQMAALIEAITAASPAAIGLDMVFAEPQPDPLKQRLQQLPTALQQPLLALLPRRSPDEQLAAALLNANRVIGGHYFAFQAEAVAVGATAEHTSPLTLALTPDAVSAVRAPATGFPLAEATAVVSSIPLLAAATNGGGFFNLPPSRDGVMRHAPLLVRYRESIYPSLALRTIAQFLDDAPLLVRAESYGVTDLWVGDLALSTDEQAAIQINYRGPTGTLPTWSAAALLAGEIPATLLQDRLVLVGATAVGIGDTHATPFSTVFPGTELQATIADNLLAGDAMRRPVAAVAIEWVAMVLLVLLLAWGLPRLRRSMHRLLLMLLLSGGYIAVGYPLFAAHHYALMLTYPLLALLLTWLAITLYLNLVVERRYSSVRSAFQSCLHPHLVDQLTERPDLLRFGGEKRDLTVLFSDIRGFTDLSERLPPEQLARLLNHYMDPMTAAVLDQGGTLDKYIGDAVMAIFGAPLPQPNHAAAACATALTMVTELERVNAICASESPKLPPLRIGIGLNSGEMVVGNLGSTLRFSYTVLGDNVNLGSRLEGLTKTYGVTTIVSEATRQLAGDEQFRFRELDWVRVKGREQPVTIHELRGYRDAWPPESAEARQEMQLLAGWQQALTAYRAQAWAAAEGYLDEIEVLDPIACGALRQRIRSAAAATPSADWDGVTRFNTK